MARVVTTFLQFMQNLALFVHFMEICDASVKNLFSFRVLLLPYQDASSQRLNQFMKFKTQNTLWTFINRDVEFFEEIVSSFIV